MEYEYRLVEVSSYARPVERVIGGKMRRVELLRLFVRSNPGEEDEGWEFEADDWRAAAQRFVGYMNDLGREGWKVRYYQPTPFGASAGYWPSGLHCFARETGDAAARG